MGSLEAYEAGLDQRLIELRSRKDVAYNSHAASIFEALVYSIDNFGRPGGDRHRILDVGCGLGFLTKRLSDVMGDGVMGIDLSKKAIEMARDEHPDTRFEVASVQEFAENGGGLFEYAILNMVLHSLEYEEARRVLENTRKCLGESGVVIAIVPADKWAVRKLVEYAQDVGMQREEGLSWIRERIQDGKAEIPVKISQGKYYPEPITIYYRDLGVYADMFSESNFGVGEAVYDDGNNLIDENIKPFHIPYDYYMTSALSEWEHDRHTLISTSLPDDWREGKWRRLKK